MGNREEVRWCALTDKEGNGVEFVMNHPLSVSALPWLYFLNGTRFLSLPVAELTGTHLYLDAAVTGLGGSSCGQGGPLEQDRVKAGN